MTLSEFSSRGGKAAAAKLTPEERKARARAAIAIRWAGHKKKASRKKKRDTK
jgi:hypothetical protein